MDYDRTGKESQLRLFTDAETLVPVRWFAAQPGAQLFPGWHVFGNADNAGDADDYPGDDPVPPPRDVDYVPRRFDGRPPPALLLGDHFCGPLRYFQNGVTLADGPKLLPAGIGGVPSCCDPGPLPLWRVGFNPGTTGRLWTVWPPRIGLGASAANYPVALTVGFKPAGRAANYPAALSVGFIPASRAVNYPVRWPLGIGLSGHPGQVSTLSVGLVPAGSGVSYPAALAVGFVPAMLEYLPPPPDGSTLVLGIGLSSIPGYVSSLSVGLVPEGTGDATPADITLDFHPGILTAAPWPIQAAWPLRIELPEAVVFRQYISVGLVPGHYPEQAGSLTVGFVPGHTSEYQSAWPVSFAQVGTVIYLEDITLGFVPGSSDGVQQTLPVAFVPASPGIDQASFTLDILPGSAAVQLLGPTVDFHPGSTGSLASTLVLDLHPGTTALPVYGPTVAFVPGSFSTPGSVLVLDLHPGRTATGYPAGITVACNPASAAGQLLSWPLAIHPAGLAGLSTRWPLALVPAASVPDPYGCGFTVPLDWTVTLTNESDCTLLDGRTFSLSWTGSAWTGSCPLGGGSMSVVISPTLSGCGFTGTATIFGGPSDGLVQLLSGTGSGPPFVLVLGTVALTTFYGCEGAAAGVTLTARGT
jgi:hypothetical protein